MALTTGKVRLSYCHLWQPYTPQNGGEPKYSVTILIPKSDVNTLNALYAEMEAVKQTGVAQTWGGKLPPVVKIPLYDGDGVRPSGEAFGEECHGHVVITASSKIQPQIVDLNVQPILAQSEVYSGMFARVSISFFSYAQNGNKGIGCGLNCIQKVADGEPLAGGVSAEEAFGGSNAYAALGGAMPLTPGASTYGYQVPTPQQYQQPVPPIPQQYQQPQYNQPASGVDPITGMPATGGVMGLS